MVERIGIFKVRKTFQGENMLHAPSTSAKEYILYQEDDGTLRYVPVKE